MRRTLIGHTGILNRLSRADIESVVSIRSRTRHHCQMKRIDRVATIDRVVLGNKGGIAYRKGSQIDILPCLFRSHIDHLGLFKGIRLMERDSKRDNRVATEIVSSRQRYLRHNSLAIPNAGVLHRVALAYQRRIFAVSSRERNNRHLLLYRLCRVIEVITRLVRGNNRFAYSEGDQMVFGIDISHCAVRAGEIHLQTGCCRGSQSECITHIELRQLVAPCDRLVMLVLSRYENRNFSRSRFIKSLVCRGKANRIGLLSRLRHYRWV